MRSGFKRVSRSVKRFMNEKIEYCTTVFFNNQNRKILGVIVIGFGIGLFVSGYVR